MLRAQRGESDQSGQMEVEPRGSNEAAQMNMSPIRELKNEDWLNNSEGELKSPVIKVADIKHTPKPRRPAAADQHKEQNMDQSQERRPQQHDDFYMKEVRTFEEVFKSIKAKAKDHQKRKEAMLKKRELAKKQHKKGLEEDATESEDDGDFENDTDLEENHLSNMYNFAQDEFGNDNQFDLDKDLSEDPLDDQDIDDQDREVLNDRILGIINVFQHIVQSNNQQSALPSKQFKALQDLGRKKMSIEKTGNNRKHADILQDKKLNITGQGLKSRVIQGNKDGEEGAKKRPPVGSSQNKSSINLNQSSSNRELKGFSSSTTRKQIMQ